MLDKFDLKALYVFSENRYYLYNGEKFTWTSVCDGLIVEPETEYIGIVKVEGEEYVVFPYSCNKIEVDVKSTETENVYGNDIINDVIGTIQTKSSLQGGKPKEFEGKIFFGIDKDNYWTDAGILSLDNLECESINNHSKELTFDKSKKYYFSMNLVAKKDMEDWMYCCDGSLVDVIDVNKGFVLDSWEDEYHIVVRKWCKLKNN
ncbi:MAG: hypothetical protein ACLS90_00235 [Clostridia bacterium]